MCGSDLPAFQGSFFMDEEDELAKSLARGGGDDESDGGGKARPRGRGGRTVLGRRLSEAQSKVVLSSVVICNLLFVGTICFKYIEETSFMRSFYWCCVSLTTVGYGDVYPVTDGGKYFACLYLLVGCVMMAKALGDIAGLPLELRRQRNERAVLDQYGETMDASEFEEILASFRALGLAGPGEASCSKAEFVVMMLLKLEKYDTRDIRRCVTIFDTLDADKSGRLDARDLVYAPPAAPS